MSIENASYFLEAIAYSEDLRIKFEHVQTSEEFLDTVQALGYNFTPEELITLAKESSEGVTLRRRTGAWKWLRQTRLNWASQP